MPLEQHFVVFRSPGTFVSEETVKEVDSWDVDQALEMMQTVTERHGASPYGFRRVTRRREDDELDSRIIARGPFRFVNCDVLTKEDVERRDGKDLILYINMDTNNIDRVAEPHTGWKATYPMALEDIVMEYKPDRKTGFRSNG